MKLFLFTFGADGPKLSGTIESHSRFTYQQRAIDLVPIDAPDEETAKIRADCVFNERLAWRALINVDSMDMIGQRG